MVQFRFQFYHEDLILQLLFYGGNSINCSKEKKWEKIPDSQSFFSRLAFSLGEMLMVTFKTWQMFLLEEATLKIIKFYNVKTGLIEYLALCVLTFTDDLSFRD